VEEVVTMIGEHGIDVANLYDEAAFKQSPLFSACVIKDSKSSLRMSEVLIEMGVLPTTQDTLNQIPLYYAVREGHQDVIALLIKSGSNVNHLDTYG